MAKKQALSSDPERTLSPMEVDAIDRKVVDHWNAKVASRGKPTPIDIIARARPHEARELRAREALGKAIEVRRHLESQVHFWRSKADEVQAVLLKTIAAHDKSVADEAAARANVDEALTQDNTYRTTKAEELRAKIAELTAQAKMLEQDEL